MARIGIDVFPLWWSVSASSSAIDDMIFFNVMHSVRMGPLSQTDGMMLEDVGFELR